MDGQKARKVHSFRQREPQAMEKLNEAVLRISRIHSSSLSPSQIEDRLRLLFRSSSSSLCHPVHPPYAEMIIAAIRELNEGGGTKEEAVSSFIKSRHQDLPIAHARLLSHHLKKLVERGEIVFSSKSHYRLPNPNPKSDKQQQKKRPRTRRTRPRTKHDPERNGELQLVVRDHEMVVPVDHVDVDVEHNQNPNTRSKKRRIKKKPEPEHREEQDVGVQDGIVSSIDCSLQLQLTSAIDMEPLKDPNEPEHQEERELVVQDEIVSSIGDDDGSLQLQSSSVVAMESLKNTNEPVQHGEQELVANDQLITPIGDNNGLTVSPQPSIEMAPLQNLKKEKKREDDRERPNKKHEPEQHGEQELVAKAQSITPMDADNWSMVAPQSIEMAPLQNPNQQKEQQKKQKDGRGKPKRNPEPEQHGERELAAKNQSITPIGEDNGLRISPQSIEMAPLQSSNQQKEQPQKKKDGRGRPKKNPVPEQHGERVLAAKGQSITPIGEDNVLGLSPQSIEMAPLQSSNQQKEQPQKKKDGRGRPKKNPVPEQHGERVLAAKGQSITPMCEDNGSMVSPQSIETAPLQKRKDGRGRPKKKKPELEQQLVLKGDIEVEPLKKKRGRPNKNKDSEDPQPVKIKRKRGRPKKNTDSENQQLVMVSPYVLEIDPLQKQLPQQKNSSKARNDNTGTTDSLAIEPVEPLQKRNVSHPPPKKISKFTLKYLQEPQLPRRILRPKPS